MKDTKKDLQNKYYVHCTEDTSLCINTLLFLGADPLKIGWVPHGTIAEGANLVVRQNGDVERVPDYVIRDYNLQELPDYIMLESQSKNTPCGEAETKELKKDAGKPKFHLLPLHDLEDVVRVYEFGCKKYSENSWRKIEANTENKNRIVSALLRHLAEWQEKTIAGEKAVDDESGLPIVSHIAWNAIMLLHLEKGSEK